MDKRNPVAKNSHLNKAATHRTAKDYRRTPKHRGKKEHS